MDRILSVQEQQQFSYLINYNHYYNNQLARFISRSVEDVDISKQLIEIMRTEGRMRTKDSGIYEKMRLLLHGNKLTEESTIRPVNSIFKGKDAEARADIRANEIIGLLPEDYKPRTILDFGCGDGSIIRSLNTKFNIDQKNAFGVDVVVPLNTNRFIFTQTTNDINARLPHTDNSIDLIVALMSLHHVGYINLWLSELYRILSSNGFLIIREHDCDSESTRVFLDVIHGLFSLVLSSPQENSNFINDYSADYHSRDVWTFLFERSQFQTVKVSKAVEYLLEPHGSQKFFYKVFTKKLVK